MVEATHHFVEGFVVLEVSKVKIALSGTHQRVGANAIWHDRHSGERCQLMRSQACPVVCVRVRACVCVWQWRVRWCVCAAVLTVRPYIIRSNTIGSVL